MAKLNHNQQHKSPLLNNPSHYLPGGEIVEDRPPDHARHLPTAAPVRGRCPLPEAAEEVVAVEIVSIPLPHNVVDGLLPMMNTVEGQADVVHPLEVDRLLRPGDAVLLIDLGLRCVPSKSSSPAISSGTIPLSLIV